MVRSLLVFCGFLISSTSFSQWINEIHYDNDGTDTGEGVEVVFPSGTDLTCYSIVGYNGSGGSSYSTTAFTGTAGDEGCGYDAVWLPISALQNGAPDGLALVDDCNGGTVIQFLSYEGVFAATNGPATGMNSTNIGVSEIGTTPIGESLQLSGSGSAYGSFSWQSPSTGSPGSMNSGQIISPCGGNTITAGAVSGSPFTVDCAGTSDNGSILFTSTGTFNPGNTFTVQLSDASGSFASPTDIGSLSGAGAEGLDPSGSISFTIPAGSTSSTLYLIRIISSDPSTVSSNSSSFEIIQSGSCGPGLPGTSGLIINEWSNGPSGNQEYYEFVVAGQCGTLVDIRGYILDDNNGTFTNPADYSTTASGIAPGHFRLSNDPQWAAIPVGSLIVIYNAEEPNPLIPADDPNDTSPTDSLYVVPHNNPLFERCTTLPGSASPDSLYTPCSYAVAPLTGWGPLSLRNSGDAIQVRNPDGTYYHGVSYGGSEMTGGPHNLKLFTGSGSDMCGWFTDGDFFDIANWSSGNTTGNQTPGLPNNPLNAAWLALMRDTNAASCPITILPVDLIGFIGENTTYGNQLEWFTSSELDADYFTLERSTDGVNWKHVADVNAVGNSQDLVSYKVIDNRFEDKINYYRLSQTDLNGEVEKFTKYVVINNSGEDALYLIGIYNVIGQPVNADYKGIQIHLYSDGTSQKIFNN